MLLRCKLNILFKKEKKNKNQNQKIVIKNINSITIISRQDV